MSVEKTEEGGAVDPITLSVIRHKLSQVCDEMDVVVERAAFCPIVSESRDRASGVYAGDNGEVVAQGETGLPLFVGSMQFAVQAALRAVGVWRAGDVAVVNDPYESGTHLMDLKLVAPVFVGGECLCFLGQTAHWTDVGGMVAGGFAPEATEIFQEGLRLPPVRLVKGGTLDEDLLAVIMANVRMPSDRSGDLSAQLGALHIGTKRIAEMAERWGVQVLRDAFVELRDRSEEHMRTLIVGIPDGSYSSRSYLDDDGIGYDPLVCSVVVTVDGSDMFFDFRDSSPPAKGPLNASPVATASAVFLALRHVFPEVPINGGCFRPLHVLEAPGTFVHGEYPRAVSGAASEVTIRVVDVVMAALSDVLPDRIGADSFGTICNYTWSGVDPKTSEQYIVFGFLGGGYGGSERGDGLSNGASSISIAKTLPLEILEIEAPVLVQRYSLREDSAGAGRFRGGFGLEVQLMLRRGEASCTVFGDRGKFAPQGRMGGESGAKTEIWWELADGKFVPPHVTKCGGVRMQEGDRLVIRTPGGGGYGRSDDRAAELVQRDHERGLVKA